MSPLLPLLPLHALLASRGDGLKPELLALLVRQNEGGAGLSAALEPDDTAAAEDQRPRCFSSTMVSKSS
jgi:hypothetical protein